MKTKRLVAVASTTFLISLLFSLAIVQSTIGTIIETRKTALKKTLSELQLDGFGAFHFVHANPRWDYSNEAVTAVALEALKVLNALGKVDVNSAVDYIASKQHPKSGGFGAYVDYDGTILWFDFYTTYEVVHTLKEIGALSKINQTALKIFVLAGYNQSLGAFSALLPEAYWREYGVPWWSLGFRSWSEQAAYAIPNLLSTFCGVSILAEIDALSLINASRTLEFIMSTRAHNGVFKPYPTAIQENLPGWSFNLTPPSAVDRDGTGIPYTYAAVGALKALGHLDILNQSDREKIIQYVLSCQSNDGDFYEHKEDDDAELYSTFYSLMTLTNIGMQDETREAISKVQNHILKAQQLSLGTQWPLPQPSPYYSDPNCYGMFQDGGSDMLGDTSLAVSILNVTNSLSLLDQPTPRALIILLNITVLSLFITGSVLFAVWGFMTLVKTRKAQKKNAS